MYEIEVRNDGSMYEIKIQHDGLDRLIRGKDLEVVKKKAKAQIRSWEAEEALADINNTLVHIIDKDCKVNREELKDFSKFDKPKPIEPKLEEVINDEIQSPEPRQSDARYQPKFGFLELISYSLKQEMIDKMVALFTKEHEEWRMIMYNNLLKHEKAKNEYLKRKEDYDIYLRRWEIEKNIFVEAQKANNENIDKKRKVREAYAKQDTAGIVHYYDMVLSNSPYPDLFPKEAEIDYIPKTRMIIVDYLFPNIDDIPKLKEVRYIQANDEFKEIYLADSVINKIYDSLLYNITLRSIYELFNADVIKAVDSIIFNGIVKSIDNSVGKAVTNCILSIQANKEEFMNINLDAVDPKACFKKLKGVSASKLYALSAIAPIMKIDREDARFIDAYGVADSLDDSVNIAAMDWQDFEHLIREIFEKEFNESGGDVKITQASRDGGVDAIAFDPDPLRGGKIAIQAKRYTNVVGVAAVRDLYGTVINEGASRGILVTTSEYGPDAYDFAKDKPITLLNGSNLLHLLNKHGHKAKIDLKEAKKLLEYGVKN